MESPLTPLNAQGLKIQEQARRELLVYGFAAVKVITEAAGLRGKSGRIECPLCRQPIRFSVVESSGHLWAACSTVGCIRMSE